MRVETGWYTDDYGVHMRRFTFWWLLLVIYVNAMGAGIILVRWLG